ncbi:MFS transporter [Lapidilactobacillus salsurivasis]
MTKQATNIQAGGRLVTILSISAVGGLALAVTSVIPKWAQAFPQMPLAAIELLVTLANLGALITLLFNPWLTRRWGSKRVIFAGLLLGAGAGCLPVWLRSYGAIAVSRFFLGLGLGLYAPHGISLIVHHYQGAQQTRLLGYQTGIGALGSTMIMLLVGALASRNWRWVFWIHGLLLLVALAVGRFLPTDRPQSVASEVRVPLPRSAGWLILLTFWTYLVIWGVQLKLPSFFSEKGFGGAQVTSLTLALMNLGGFAAGMLFGRSYRLWGRHVLTAGYMTAAVAVFGLLLAPNQGLAIMAAVGFNFAYSFTGPYLVVRSQQGLAPNQVEEMSSYLTIVTIVSAFLAPIWWNLLGEIGWGPLTQNVLVWVIALLLLLALIVALVQSHLRRIKRGNQPRT